MMKSIALLSSVFALLLGSDSFGQIANQSKRVKETTEREVRQVVEPILNKYCSEQCRLLNVNAEVDVVAPDAASPGFEEVSAENEYSIAATSVQVKMLIDEMVGPVSRGKIFDLIQEYIDVLDYPVYIETKVTRFPQPLSSARKVAELRDELSKKVKKQVSDVLKRFCPEQCLLGELDIKTEQVNPEESQYGAEGEFVHSDGTALKINKISGKILFDETLTAEEQQNVLEMITLRTNEFKNVAFDSQSMRFPSPVVYGPDGVARLAGRGRYGNLSKSETDSKNSSTSSSSSKDSKESNLSKTSQLNKDQKDQKSESYTRTERYERVEDGDAVQALVKRVTMIGGFITGFIILLLVILIALIMTGKAKSGVIPTAIQRFLPFVGEGTGGEGKGSELTGSINTATKEKVAKRYEIERLLEELTSLFAENPRVAKMTFTRVLKEEGIEITASYVSIFGESIVVEMLRDPSLQGDVNDLMEFFAKNQFDFEDEEKLDLLKALHNRAIAAKLVVTGNRTSHQFEFLADMDAPQIQDLVKNESLTVKAIVMTQCDHQKRNHIFNMLDEQTQVQLLSELSRIDHLPKDYISNVAQALKRKRQENPKLNTEALPGSEVLVSLLEKTDVGIQRSIIHNLEETNPDNARAVKSKLVSLDTLAYIRDAQLLEIVLNLKHSELLQFLKGCPESIQSVIFQKSPPDLVDDLREELSSVAEVGKEAYENIERKVVNRIKVMAHEGTLNLIETNEQMFADKRQGSDVEQISDLDEEESNSLGIDKKQMKKAAGW